MELAEKRPVRASERVNLGPVFRSGLQEEVKGLPVVRLEPFAGCGKAGKGKRDIGVVLHHVEPAFFFAPQVPNGNALLARGLLYPVPDLLDFFVAHDFVDVHFDEMVDVCGLDPVYVRVDIAVVNLLAACHGREGATVRDEVIELPHVIAHEGSLVFEGRKDVEFRLGELGVEIAYESICGNVQQHLLLKGFAAVGAGDGVWLLFRIFLVREETVEIHVLGRVETELFDVEGSFIEEYQFLVQLAEIPARKLRDFVVSETERANLIRG